MSLAVNDQTEWLEPDGLGGFASGTTSGVRTRRYHALLLSAMAPPTARVVLVNGVDARVQTPSREFELSAQRYAPGMTTGSPNVRIESFQMAPWPQWVYLLSDATRIRHEIFARHGSPVVAASWRVISGSTNIRLRVRPLLSARDYHSLHHENPAFRFDGAASAACIRWSPYPGLPSIIVRHNGGYRHDPLWYRSFQYEEERQRGFEFTEDLASPGVIEFDLSTEEAAMILTADTPGNALKADGKPVVALLGGLRDAESGRRRLLGGRLEVSADAYIVQRDAGKTILAGYPWFTDWGRDTFISIRGLCLATGRLSDAGEILARWAAAVSEGMIPNRFPDKADDAPDYNSVDASLWFVVAVHDLFERAQQLGATPSSEQADSLRSAVQAIVAAYANGARHRIRMDADGLLSAGEPGVQLTWMDARIGDHVVTPRIGKPVELQALWINALWIATGLGGPWNVQYERALQSFRRRFWNDDRGCLFDVVDADHVSGKNDPRLRPNQIMAVGGLPLSVLDGEHARRVVETVEARLLTPVGLRTLAPGEAEYAPRYEGGPAQRDAVYHQGTVWPWLLGPFVEAWVRVHGGSPKTRRTAREQFLNPLMRTLDEAGIGHISEIADADPPHRPRGCPFQAWSLGELLRLDRIVLNHSVHSGSQADAAGKKSHVTN